MRGKAITVRNLTSSELDSLRRLAREHSRSLAGEIRYVLRAYLIRAKQQQQARDRQQ